MMLQNIEEALKGVFTGILLWMCYGLMHEYLVFVAIALLHNYWLINIDRRKTLIILSAYLLSYLILWPHNFYVIFFMMIIYGAAWILRRVRPLPYQALVCLAITGLLHFKIHWVLVAVVQLNRILDGTYMGLLF